MGSEGAEVLAPVPTVYAAGFYCPKDGGDVQVMAVMIEQPLNEQHRIPALRLLCVECDWTGAPGEAIHSG